MTIFHCPNCGGPLAREPHRLACPAGHSFDLAKSGYVNLLLSHGAGPKHHGDDKRMVKARSTFLQKGHYAPMRQELLRQGLAAASENMVVLDAGCGEGYYTAALAELLRQQGLCPHVAGIDISKEALQEAAKRDRQSEYAVASCFHLPVGDGSVDLLLSVFAPYCGEEFLRVLCPGGSFLMVIPLENHLYGLKQAIYEKPYRNEVKPYDLPGFRLEECRELRYQITLHGQEEIESLFMMTPYYYKTGAADQQKLLTKTTLTTPAEFAVLRYKKI